MGIFSDLLKTALDSGIGVLFVVAGLLLILLFILDRIGTIVLPVNRRNMAGLTGIVFVVFGFLIADKGNEAQKTVIELIIPTQVQEQIQNLPTSSAAIQPTETLAANIQTPTALSGSLIQNLTATPTFIIPISGNREADLLARNILLSGDPANLEERREWVSDDKQYQALVDNTITLLGNRRLINSIHLDTYKGVFTNLADPVNNNPPLEMYADAELLRAAIQETWELNYPAVDTIEQMLMPATLIQGGENTMRQELIGADLISLPIKLVSDGQYPAEEYCDYNRYLLQGKNWIAITLDLHGLFLDTTGDSDAIIIDQPVGGAWHYAKLSDYVQNGYDGEQTVFIRLADFKQDGGPLNLSAPVGTLHFRIWTNSIPFIIDITRIVAYYSAG